MGWISRDDDGIVVQIDIGSIGCESDPEEGGAGVGVVYKDK